MSDEHTTYKSRFAVGDSVYVTVGTGLAPEAFVRSVTFTAQKVFYAVYLKNAKSVIHHVDSAMVHPCPEPGEDVYDDEYGFDKMGEDTDSE